MSKYRIKFTPAIRSSSICYGCRARDVEIEDLCALLKRSMKLI